MRVKPLCHGPFLYDAGQIKKLTRSIVRRLIDPTGTGHLRFAFVEIDHKLQLSWLPTDSSEEFHPLRIMSMCSAVRLYTIIRRVVMRRSELVNEYSLAMHLYRVSRPLRQSTSAPHRG